MFLADKASDDGSGICCSKGTVQRHTEFSESTVKRTIIDFLGYTRSKVCVSDNWFKMRRWEKRLAQIQADREKAREAEAKGRASLGDWTHERHPLCRHITNRQIEDLIASKLVTPEQVRAEGLQAKVQFVHFAVA